MDSFFELFAVIASVTFSIAAWRGWIKFGNTHDVAELRREVASLSTLLQYEKDERSRERDRMFQQLSDAYERIGELEKNISSLEHREERLIERLHELESLAAPGRVRVLCIWPNPESLDLRGERNAIDDAGISYQALWGENATRENILRELRIDGFTIIEIGAEGTKDGFVVYNGEVLDAGFWAGALERRTICVALLLACHSDTSVADVFRNRGVRHVISAIGQVSDASVVRFTRVFYQAYAHGNDVSAAFRDARLILDRDERERIILR